MERRRRGEEERGEGGGYREEMLIFSGNRDRLKQRGGTNKVCDPAPTNLPSTHTPSRAPIRLNRCSQCDSQAFVEV